MDGITFIFSQAIIHFGIEPFIFVIISVIIMIIITTVLVYKELKGEQ